MRTHLTLSLRVTASVGALLVASQAYAQEASDTAANESDDASVIVVTGTNISGVKPVGSEAISLDREQIISTGMTNAADVVRTLPQVRNLGEFREGGTQGSNNSQQGNAINLRGLGAAATLVLVDGRRVVATGASANFTEANQVPLAALERIEVIADGASAVYGSDAVAGVVNFVLRKDYEGVEASFRAGNTNGGWEYSPSVTAGANWDAGGLGHGNIIVSYEYTHRNPYLRGRTPWLRQDLRPVGGPDTRINGSTGAAGAPGNIFIENTGIANPTIPLAGSTIYYGLPSSATGLGITAADLRLNDPNLIDTADYTDYTGRVERHQLTAYLNQDLTDWLSFFASGTYSHRHTYSRQISSFLGSIENVTVPAFLYDPVTNTPDFTRPNPAYIAGIPGIAPGAPISVQYNFFDSTGHQNWDNTVENYNITGGFRVKLPFDWQGEAYYTYGYDDACNFCALGTNINPDSLQYMINIGEINPFSQQLLTQSQLDRLYGDNIQSSGNEFKDFVVKFNGPLFDLPGGTVRAALGGEIAHVANWNLNGRNKGIDNVLVIDTDKERSIGKRTIKSVFGELYVPLIGRDMDAGIIREFSISAAVRHDDYSDVGSTTNPKIGATLDLGDIVSLRGSWGTSFRAPGLPDVNPAAISGAFTLPLPNNNPNIANDFCLGTICYATVGALGGANPDIGPEKATNWSIGGDFTPTDRLRISATYYNVSYTDRIGGPGYGLGLSLFGNPGYPTYGGYAGLIHPINNTNVTGPDTCDLDPLLADYLSRPILYGTTLTTPCFIKAIADGRNVNMAATQQDGLDVSIDYQIPIQDGSITLGGAVNKLFSNKIKLSETDAFTDVKGRADQPVEWRGRGSIAVNWKEFSGTLFVNYTGGYENTGAINPATGAPVGTQHVNSWTTLDLTLGYNPDLNSSLLKGLRLSATVQNLMDKDPPLMITANGAFNGSYANPFGRTFSMQVTTSF